MNFISKQNLHGWIQDYQGNVAGIDGSPNFSSIKIFLRQVRQKLQIKAELETCNIGNCSEATKSGKERPKTGNFTKPQAFLPEKS